MLAREFLQTLPAAQNIQSVLDGLRPLLDKPASVTSGQRRGLLYISSFFALLCSSWLWTSPAFKTLLMERPDPMAISDKRMPDSKTPSVGTRLTKQGDIKWKESLSFLSVFGAFAVPSLPASLFFRRGLGYRLLKVEIVTETGCPAPRWRTFLRCLVAWLPLLIFLPLVPLTNSLWPLGLSLSLVLGGIVYKLVRPGSAIRDRLVGTWLVPE